MQRYCSFPNLNKLEPKKDLSYLRGYEVVPAGLWFLLMSRLAIDFFSSLRCRTKLMKSTNSSFPEMPYKMMPVLEIDGKKVSQSEAILRYVARELGLAGKTSFDQAIADEFAGAMKDISLTIPWVEKDEEKRVRKLNKLCLH